MISWPGYSPGSAEDDPTRRSTQATKWCILMVKKHGSLFKRKRKTTKLLKHGTIIENHPPVSIFIVGRNLPFPFLGGKNDIVRGPHDFCGQLKIPNCRSVVSKLRQQLFYRLTLG